MDRGYEWLESIARGMKAAVASGAAPTLERLIIREFLAHFGYVKRGNWINGHIRNGLEKYNLITMPDFEYPWIDSTVTITLDPDVVAGFESTPKTDPTLRIGSLEAANTQPESVKPQSPLSEAITVMRLHNYSQLPVMTNQHEVGGMIS